MHLQVVFGNTTTIHPQAQTLVADELDGTYCLVNGLELFLVAIEPVLVDQHALDFPFFSVVALYLIIVLYVKKG